MNTLKWFGAIAIGLFVLAFISGLPQELYKEYTFRSFYSKLTTATMNDDMETLYATLSPEERRDISFNDYVTKYSRKEKPIHEDYVIHSYNVIGDRGIVDRTYIVCYENCDGENRTETRIRKEYVFVNGQWYAIQDNTVLCARSEPYVIPEEFSRAVSLIIQRLENSNYAQAGTSFSEEDRKHAKALKKMRNCLNIQYANSIEEMEGAEGQFFFLPGNNNDELFIRVSPEYSIKDDLVTAILLRHELHHAYLHATGYEQITSCIENEAEAFAVEIGFFDAMNVEEKKSLIARYSSTEGIKDFFDMREAILANPGKYTNERALPFVQNSEFYQTQCAETN